jgi:hypothetical protein
MKSNWVVLPLLAGVGLAGGLALTQRGSAVIAPAATSLLPGTPKISSLRGHDAETTTVTEPAGRELTEQQPHSEVPDAAHVATRQGPNDESYGAPATPPEFPVYDASAVTLGEEHSIPSEVSGASDADQRAATIRALDTSPSASADPLSLLEQTLQADETSRNRLLAVNSLRQLGKQGDQVERVRAALRTAMSDGDENVATSARDAYQEIAR